MVAHESAQARSWPALLHCMSEGATCRSVTEPLSLPVTSLQGLWKSGLVPHRKGQSSMRPAFRVQAYLVVATCGAVTARRVGGTPWMLNLHALWEKSRGQTIFSLARRAPRLMALHQVQTGPTARQMMQLTMARPWASPQRAGAQRPHRTARRTHRAEPKKGCLPHLGTWRRSREAKRARSSSALPVSPLTLGLGTGTGSGSSRSSWRTRGAGVLRAATGARCSRTRGLPPHGSGVRPARRLPGSGGRGVRLRPAGGAGGRRGSCTASWRWAWRTAPSSGWCGGSSAPAARTCGTSPASALARASSCAALAQIHGQGRSPAPSRCTSGAPTPLKSRRLLALRRSSWST
mmetsp:Transcript_90839/g.282552  ORF Transcript_90839/g.282552 Transcript_90839/m.282552 type:complete len:348 (-) Transcript_90839:216-1259(-)